MTTNDDDRSPNLELMSDNLKKIEELSQRLVAAFGEKREIDPSLQGPGQDLYMKAATNYMAEAMANPSKLIEHQVAYWGQTLKHYIDIQESLGSGEASTTEKPVKKDRRFSNPLWDTHPYFSFVKEQYLINAKAIDDAVSNIEGLESKDKQRLKYFSRQITDLLSPANFLGTNPEALTRAVETDGQSLVAGLENLVRDLEANDGELVVTLADKNAFKIGENLATTKGAVVYRNRMFELLQYTPTTDKVHKTPLVIFPPWINKFYIMDLKEKNSLIKWIVDQGYTLFVVSWVDPDARYADVGMDTYVEEGYLTAIQQVKEITGEDQINAVGYCIAGTTLGLTLSLMSKRKDTSIKSATFFTTMTDFSDQGEFGVFLDDGFVDGIEREANENGVLDSFFMSRTFSYLRSNDLIYGPAIRNYMMGEAPPAFDLLYWNSDGTDLAARMTVEYLRGLCQDNKFAKGTFELLGETLALKDVDVPLCAIACEADHIAAWRTSYTGVAQMGSKNKTFILSESGHVAGIINPPSKMKYGHYTNPKLEGDADHWKANATFNEGSWWPTWETWLRKRSGAKVDARSLGGANHPILAEAPGTYVLGKPSP
ncbi:MAG: class I poly(R)-hydroxyalkanoic acid synthase [Marinosulfonomonas sp.]